MTEIEPHKYPEVVYSGLAILGGAAKYAKAYLDNGMFSLSKLLANLVLSGFSGFIFGELASSMNLSYSTGIIFAGVGGFIGSDGIYFLWTIIRKHIK